MPDAIQFALTDEQMADFLTWRAQVEAETGNPIEGVVFSFLVTSHGLRQILIRPSTDRDFKLKGVARIDGTYDTFAPHEEVLAEYDNFGFASTTIYWRDLGIRVHICFGALLERGVTPRCYVGCVNDPHRPFIPFRVSDQPEVCEDDELLKVFPYTPLPPEVAHRIQDFIRTNVAALLQHWNGESSSRSLLEALEPQGGLHRTDDSAGGEDD